MDKSWSVLPVCYLWWFALHDRLSVGGAHGAAVLHPRQLAMAALGSAWGARLSLNFARKRGYAWRGEDYRWPVLRAAMHPLVFQVGGGDGREGPRCTPLARLPSLTSCAV